MTRKETIIATISLTVGGHVLLCNASGRYG